MQIHKTNLELTNTKLINKIENHKYIMYTQYNNMFYSIHYNYNL